MPELCRRCEERPVSMWDEDEELCDECLEEQGYRQEERKREID